MTAVRESAIAAYAAGISVLPPKQDGTKAPDSHRWAQYQKTPATLEQIQDWYSNGRTGVGWVTGHVSGDLEVIDFDDRSTLAEFDRLCVDAGIGELFVHVKKGYYERTPNGGHLVYRCSEIAGNTKLAKSREKKSLIETRGEGGFIIVAPTFGSVNQRGAYVLESGGVDTIAVITPEQRRSLHDVARMLDESIAPIERPFKMPTTKTGDRPGDDYNARVAWADVLVPHGWARVSDRMGVTSWRRPDKKIGISATTNHAESDLLYVFSSSTCFEAERGYSKFSAYAILQHGGDFVAASKDLALLGYGTAVEIPEARVDLSRILARFQKPTRDPPTIKELLRVPGLVGELAAWFDQASYRRQPVLALGASIATVGTILGRKVQSSGGMRTNVYCVGVGETGCGKEAPRTCIKELFREIGAVKMLGSKFASGAAVETSVSDSAACLFLIDELGHYLGSIKNDQQGHLRAVVPVLMELYSSSQSYYRRNTYADKERNAEGEAVIDQPCLSIYATTVPSNFFGGITKAQADDGFLGRLLVFQSSDHDPYLQYPSAADREIPTRVLDGFKYWLGYKPTNHEAVGNLVALRASPLVVPATPAALAVLDGIEDRMRPIRAQVRERGGQQGPYMRIRATAEKLALIRACGVIYDNPEITEADAQWGVDLAWHTTSHFFEKFEACVVENRVEESCFRIREVIAKGGEDGVKKEDITKATRHLRPGERNDALQTLIESREIVSWTPEKTGGRPGTRFRLA